ncbi:uncharacterized protein [Montipora foliosa]|uniref:uncharacterized protein n=1 Tax=Montipora foliosa TaxID=591990 RepID=UPI0035F1EEC5
MEVRISIPEGTPPPKEGEVKHVEFTGKDERKNRFRYKKLENTRFFKCLEHRMGRDFRGEIMIVTFKTQMQEEANIAFCKRILKSGIFCDKKRFNFLGHSDSQVREKTCFMMHGTKEEIQNHLKTFGDFVEDSNVSVRAKKIGLLFSPFIQQVELTKEQCDEVSKVKKFGYGFMSRRLLSKIREEGFEGLNDPEPSALLVHYQGSQGMLVLKEGDTNNHHPMRDHSDESMRQPTIPDSHFVYILDYSQPNENAYLDAKLIMLLVARGVRVEDLRTRQTDYYSLLEDMMRNDKASIDYFLQLTGRTSEEEEVATLLQKEVSHMRVEQETTGGEVPHVKILIPKSRKVFGVCDPYGKLTPAQCYFRPTLLHDQEKEFETEKKIFVAPSPCYYPGDIQVLQLTHEKEGYENLNNCLVLHHSLAFRCGGADLSGHKFIVCWDAKLIPKQEVKPILYEPTSFETGANKWAKWRWCLQNSQSETTKDLREELIDHFASFKRDNLPILIDRIHMVLAQEESGLSQKQCKQLSRMFYQATNSMINKEALWKKLEELSDEGEGTFGQGSAGFLSYCICNPFQRDREFHVNGNILSDFEDEANRFVQKAKQNHYFD